MITLPRVSDIREEFKRLLENKTFVKDKTGCDLIEIAGCSFIADEESIFGEVNWEYVDREISWYKSLSLSVKDIPPPIPKIWEAVSSKCGKSLINSNYGWCIWSKENHTQYYKCLDQLLADPSSRRAIMIYTRPSIQDEYNTNGMSDFICTNAVQYMIRDGKLNAYVTMRSNDAWAGYRNDRAWQKYVLERLTEDYNKITNSDVQIGDIIWSVASLHLYARQFYLVR